MPISHRYRCCHIHIPKTGGTSIEQALGTFKDWKEENLDILFGMTKSQDNFVSSFLQHLTAAEVLDIRPNEFQKYFKFTFVRNPWDRFYSAYAKKDVHMVKEARKEGIEIENMSLDEFADFASTFRHAHIVPQTEYVYDEQGRVLLDFVGRYELFARDFQVICRMIGADVQLPHANRSSRNDYRSAYTTSSREAVRRIYESDVERFGYAF